MNIQSNNLHPRFRFKEALPRIDISPVFDGLMDGVRESLEDQTMNLATNVAKFFSENLIHPHGSPIECVIADSCIGRITETAMITEKFKKEDVGVSLTVTPCKCYGSETIDMDPKILKAIWGFIWNRKTWSGILGSCPSRIQPEEIT